MFTISKQASITNKEAKSIRIPWLHRADDAQGNLVPRVLGRAGEIGTIVKSPTYNDHHLSVCLGMILTEIEVWIQPFPFDHQRICLIQLCRLSVAWGLFGMLRAGYEGVLIPDWYQVMGKSQESPALMLLVCQQIIFS